MTKAYACEKLILLTGNQARNNCRRAAERTPAMDMAYYSDAKVAALQAAFNRVAPAGNWKTAIDAIVVATIAEVGLIREAVTFYTGSVAHATIVEPVSGERRDGSSVVTVRIQAAGYYVAVGA